MTTLCSSEMPACLVNLSFFHLDMISSDLKVAILGTMLERRLRDSFLRESTSLWYSSIDLNTEDS